MLADAMLSTHTTVDSADIIHDERFDHVLSPRLQTLVLVARQDNVEVQVAVTDMAVTIW